MYKVPDAFKLNKFKHIEIPSPSRFAQRNGLIESPSSLGTGDAVMQASLDKVQSMQEGIRVYEQYAAEEAKKEVTSSDNYEK